PSRAWAPAGPSVGGPPASSGFVPGSVTSSGDLPQGGVFPATASEQSISHRNHQRAVAVLAALAVILAVVLAFVVIRRGDGGDSADSGAASTRSESTGNESSTSIDVAALATDDGSLPDVVGLRTADARAVLDASGFGVAIPSHCFDTVESQTPESGAVADASTTVALQYAPCVVPDFVGLRLPEAERIVEEEFVVGLLISWPSHCDDLVVEQSVESGSVVEPGTEVELTLADDCAG
ncbi:MAG: PASTA domain-containing protein, partial [Ilumatobacter sp.]